MASSSNRKSNSSGSNAAKPTFRRAGSKARSTSGAPRAGRAARPASKGAARPVSSQPSSKRTIGSYTATPRKGLAVKQRPAASARGSLRPKAGAVRPGTKPPTRPVAQKAAPSGTAKNAAKAARPTARPAASLSGKGAVSSKLKQPVAQGKRLKPRKTLGRSLTSVAGAARPTSAAKASPVAAVVGALARVRIPVPKIPAKVLAPVIGGLVVVAIVAIVVINSALFSAKTIIINGSEHVPQATVEQLIEIPAGTTLLNVNDAAIASSLEQNPWIVGVTVERQFPDTLIITPREREVVAIAYIEATDIAWAIGADNTWISPMSLSVTVDAEGNIVSDGTTAVATELPADPAATDAAGEDGGTDSAAGEDAAAQDDATQDAAATDTAATDAAAAPAQDGTQRLEGLDAALALARRDGAVLFIDVAADVSASSGHEVESDVILAGLEYARGFSDEFVAQIRDISLVSAEAISANLVSGVEVLLGEPVDIALKERVVTRLLEQEQGVTYINVRTPDNYTFRSAA